jgi:cytochrome c oxidase cbb3-type subunit 3
MSSSCRDLALPLLLCVTMLVAACERERREIAGGPPDTSPSWRPMTTLIPGGAKPAVATDPAKRHFLSNAYHLAQGKQLYKWFNCNGCHGEGGGGSGPALMDDKWIYGGELEDIHNTIRDGRPRGMPAFGAKIIDEQIWEIAAYVLSMSGRAPAAAAPGRNDEMMSRPSENRQPKAMSKGKTP